MKIRGLDTSLPEDSILSLIRARLARTRHNTDVDRLDTAIAHRTLWTNQVRAYDLCGHQFSLKADLERATTLFEDGHMSYANYISLLTHAESAYNAFWLLTQKYPHRVCRITTAVSSGDFVRFLVCQGLLEYVSVKFAEYSNPRKISSEYLEYIMTEIHYIHIYTRVKADDPGRQIERLRRLREWLLLSQRDPWYSHRSSLFGGREQTATGLVRTRLLHFLTDWIAYTDSAFEPEIFEDIIQGIPSGQRALFKVPWPRSSTKIERWGLWTKDHSWHHHNCMHIYLEVPMNVLIQLRRLRTSQPPPVYGEYRNFILKILTEGVKKERPSALFVETWKSLPPATDEAKIFPEQFFRLKTKEDRKYVTEAATLEFVRGYVERKFSVDQQALTGFVEKRLEENAFDQTSLADFENALVERGHAYYPTPQNPWPPAVSEDFTRQPDETAKADWHQELEKLSAQKEKEREYFIGNNREGFRGFSDGDAFVITSRIDSPV